MSFKHILKLVLTWVAVLGLFPVGCLTAYVGLMAYGSHQKRPVVGVPMPSFPLLVVTPAALPGQYQANIVPPGDLEKFASEHPNYSFLVPLYWEQEFRKQLAQQNYFLRSLAVERLTNGRQAIHLVADRSDHEFNRSWYEAGDKDYVPKYHEQYTTEGLSMVATVPATLVGAALTIGAAFWVGRRSKKHKSPPRLARNKSPPPLPRIKGND